MTVHIQIDCRCEQTLPSSARPVETSNAQRTGPYIAEGEADSGQSQKGNQRCFHAYLVCPSLARSREFP